MAAAARVVPLRPHWRPHIAADHGARSTCAPTLRDGPSSPASSGPSSFPTAGWTMPGWWSSMRATRPDKGRGNPHPHQGRGRPPRGRSLGCRDRGPDHRRRAREIHARMLINAAGPWIDRVLGQTIGRNDAHNVRLVKGSHIVIRRKFEDPRSFFFQNSDGRIFFAIPYEDDFTLIGTTDEDFPGDPANAAISDFGDRLSLRVGQRIFRRAGTPRRHRVDLCRRAAALRRWRGRRPGSHARLCN